MIKIIQNTDVINPCDYDQGSSMYMRCEECIKIDCNRREEKIKAPNNWGYRWVQIGPCEKVPGGCANCNSYQRGEL